MQNDKTHIGHKIGVCLIRELLYGLYKELFGCNIHELLLCINVQICCRLSAYSFGRLITWEDDLGSIQHIVQTDTFISCENHVITSPKYTPLTYRELQ